MAVVVVGELVVDVGTAGRVVVTGTVVPVALGTVEVVVVGIAVDDVAVVGIVLTTAAVVVPGPVVLGGGGAGSTAATVTGDRVPVVDVGAVVAVVPETTVVEVGDVVVVVVVVDVVDVVDVVVVVVVVVVDEVVGAVWAWASSGYAPSRATANTRMGACRGNHFRRSPPGILRA